MRHTRRNPTTLGLCHDILPQNTGQEDKSIWVESELVLNTEHALDRDGSGILGSNDTTSSVSRCRNNRNRRLAAATVCDIQA